MTDPCLLPQSKVEVDLDALGRNINTLKALTGPGTLFMAVVKANAYGHGAVETARTALDNGADFLGVARISEAVELRQAGIKAPVLLFGEVLPEQVEYLCANDIRATITGLAAAQAASKRAAALNTRLKVHIKVDSGMGRLGIVIAPPKEEIQSSADVIKKISGLPGLEVEGMYTHMPKADETDLSHAEAQVSRFTRLIRVLEEMEIRPKLCHAANSAGVIGLPQSHLDMVRPGIALYGLAPSGDMDLTPVSLSPVMTIKSRIIQVKSVPKGFTVSYGATHVTQAPTRIATVPIGYADGYSRLLSNRGRMLVKGIKAPVIGRVCMDFTMIDVGGIPDVEPGEEVVILGTQGRESVSADEIAGLMQTINYEVTAGLTARMPVIHKNGI